MEMEWKQPQPQPQEENSSFDVLGEFQGEAADMMVEQQQILYDELLTPLEHLKTSGFCSSAESDIDSLLLDHVLDSVTLRSSASGCLSMQEDSEMDMDWFSEFETSEQDPNSEQLVVVDSNTTGDHQTPSNEQQQKRNEEQEQEANPLPTLSSDVPCRARSKRRSHVRLPTPEPAAQEAPDMYATISEAELQCALKMMNGMHRKNKRKSGNPRRQSNSKAGQRRCSHCSTQKTPQWRMGPLGPKTLCNACGVRFMSGRLYPEYRPAKSPTFISLLHSNCHRRVLQLRSGLFPFRIVPNPATAASSPSVSSPSESQPPDLS